MRVLHVLHYAPPFAGGVVDHLLALGRALEARGDSLLLAFPESRDWHSRLRGVAEVMILPSIEQPLRTGFAPRLRRLVAERGIDLTQLWFSFALPLALASYPGRRVAPLLYHWHNPPLALMDAESAAGSGRLRLKRPWARALARLADRRAIDLHLVISNEIRELLLRDRWTSDAKMRLLPNGISELPTTQTGRAGPLSDPVIGAVMNFRPQKDHATLLSAFARLRDALPAARLILVGDGPTRSDVEALAKSLSIHDAVEFLGHRDDLDLLYRRFDLAVVSSHYEGHSLALLEAMGRGLPVVATDLGTVRETLGPELATATVPARDATALSSALRRWAEDGAARRAWGGAARRRIEERYTLDCWTRRLIEIYEEAWATRRL
ncbi:MAG: glycosyltransferase family 4 protein [Candidatus Eisenbacteria bacterium]